MPEQNPLASAVALLVKAHDEEVARTSRRLHDDVAQILSALGLRLGILRMDFSESAKFVAELNECHKLLERAIDSVRSLSFDLNPSAVERAGLEAALKRLTEHYRGFFTGLIELSYDSSVKMPTPLARSLYNIVERAMENAVRHSGARRIEIRLKGIDGSVCASLTDDGRGFDYDEEQRNPSGVGLLLMRLYAAQNGLNLEISSRDGQGTIVRAQCTV